MTTRDSRELSIRRLAALYGRNLERERLAGATPKVAVVGAGLAGLVCTHLLRSAGCAAQLFEASDRTGGRIRTDFGHMEPGLTCEHGGEFIDSTHHDMLALARWCGLKLVDTGSATEASFRTAYHFRGQHYSEEQVLAAYRPVATRIAADAAALTDGVSRSRHGPADLRLDRQSIAEYLQAIDMEPWLRSLLSVAYETEMGLDCGELSSIGLVSMIGTDPSKGFDIFGDSDERYKVPEGLERIAQRLAQSVAPELCLRHRLTRVRPSGAAYVLSFETDGGPREVRADAVVLALPFTLLRHVDMGEWLPPLKRECIRTLGYGTNAKLIVGLHSRPWREQAFEGGLYTDLSMQTGWDGSRQHSAGGGIYTWFMGGTPAQAMGDGPAQDHADAFSREMDAVFPGFRAARSGSVARVHWPTEPLARGSYSCYRTGQYTRLAGWESRRVGHLYFAGEHCSREFQGYMNGAAETGRRAAMHILSRVH